MATIYLPSDYTSNCNVVYNGYIRSYTNSTYTQWVDIYINQDYMLKPGSSNYSQSVVCDTVNDYTDDQYYRIGQRSEWFSTLILALLFALFLFEIRRFSKYESA